MARNSRRSWLRKNTLLAYDPSFTNERDIIRRLQREKERLLSIPPTVFPPQPRDFTAASR